MSQKFQLCQIPAFIKKKKKGQKTPKQIQTTTTTTEVLIPCGCERVPEFSHNLILGLYLTISK